MPNKAAPHVTVHLFAALPASDSAPEWVQLTPAGTFSGVDGRGPYTLADPAAVIAASMADGKLAIDENHATDLAAPKGLPSPARGWIVALEARADGLWGQVEWTPEGEALLASRAYRGLSPALMVSRAGARVMRIVRASLTNDPNLELPTLHQRSGHDMDVLAELRQALGLAEDADAAAAIAAVNALKDNGGATALHAQQRATLKAIAKAAGVAGDADAATVLNAVATLADPAKHVPADQVKALQTQLTTLSETVAREKAEAAVDAAIAAGKPGVTALRDHYIARHMKDPEAVARELAALPSLTGASGARATPPAKDKDGKLVLNAAQAAAAKVLGVSAGDYAKTLAAEAAEQEEDAE